MGTIPCKSVRQGVSMTIGKWARLLLLAAPVLAGCKGFFDAPAGGGGGGSSTLTSGVFYVLNQATAQIAAYSVVAGVLTPVTGSPYALGTSPYSIAIAPNGAFLDRKSTRLNSSHLGISY